MRKDAVDIIVPCYNAEKSIEKCVRSLMEQTYKNIKIILVNDGSSDMTLSIISQLSREDERIIVKTIKNGGVSNARNIGIKCSDSEFICFVDSDDFVTKSYVTDLISKKNYDLVISGYIRMTQNNKIKIQGEKQEKKNLEELGDSFGKLYQKSFFNAPWGKLFHRSIIEENNIYFDIDKDFGEDTEFNLEYLKHTCSIACIEKINYFYIWFNQGNLTNKFSQSKIFQYQKIYMGFKQFIRKKHLYSKKNKYSLEKQFLKGCCIVMEENLQNSKERLLIESLREIKSFINKNNIGKLCVIDPEYWIYVLVFKANNIKLIYMFSKIRKKLKERILK